MPRQGVPYPSREICSLKCQIDALQRQINELMKSINGVQGDGQGNVSLLSGDPAIVINNDAVQNQIEIALDQSQLPAAAVSSVNGQTGAVDLDGADIPLNPGQSTPTVQNAVAANAGNISQLQQDLNQEIMDRGNADSALQSNINAVSAGLPAAAAAAVAADPTVALLVSEDAQNVKLSGAQTVGGVKTFTAIPIVPTPAAGSTDGSVPNTNWISQTGDSSPNNLVHRSGNETIDGNKTLTGITNINIYRLTNTGGSGYKILYRFKNNHAQTLLMTGGRTIVIAQVLNTGGYKKVLATSGRDYTSPAWLWTVRDGTTGEYYLVCRGLYSATMNIHVINSFLYGSVYPHQDDIELMDQSTTDPTTDSRWSSVTEVGNYD